MLVKRSNSICHFHCLAGNSTIIFSNNSAFFSLKVFISSRSSTVRGVMFTCWVTSLTTCIQLWLFINKYLTSWYKFCTDWSTAIFCEHFGENHVILLQIIAERWSIKLCAIFFWTTLWIHNSNSTCVVGICCSPVPELVVVDVLNKLHGNERWFELYQRTSLIGWYSPLRSVCQTDMHCTNKTTSDGSHKAHSSLIAQNTMMVKLKAKASYCYIETWPATLYNHRKWPVDRQEQTVFLSLSFAPLNHSFTACTRVVP